MVFSRAGQLSFGNRNDFDSTSFNREDLIVDKFESNSRIRKCCFNVKRNMIVSPLWNFFMTIIAGFFFNLPVMTTLLLVWEKYNIDTMSYSASFIPIIVLVSTLIGVVFIAVFGLGNDLLDKGCLTWHRDALGQFFQVLVCLTCLLLSAVHVQVYI